MFHCRETILFFYHMHVSERSGAPLDLTQAWRNWKNVYSPTSWWRLMTESSLKSHRPRNQWESTWKPQVTRVGRCYTKHVLGIPLTSIRLLLSAVNCSENQKVWCKPETRKKKTMKLVLTWHISKGENCYFCRWMALFLSLPIGNCFYRHVFCANCRQQKQPASDKSNEEDLVQHPVSIQLHLATGSLQPLQ